MEENGFYFATRVVNPILMKYRDFIIRTYGLKVVDEPLNFLQFSDVAVYAELERMRDDFALGRIPRDAFVEKLVELASRYSDLSPEAVQVLRELYERLTGLSFPIQRQAAAPKLVEEPSGATPMRGVCARCAVEGDRSEKPLVRCSYCGDSFCEKHAAPRLTMSFNQYQAYVVRYPDIAHLLKEHWESETGHPCTAYTSKFWREYHKSRRESGQWITVPVEEVEIKHVLRVKAFSSGKGGERWRHTFSGASTRFHTSTSHAQLARARKRNWQLALVIIMLVVFGVLGLRFINNVNEEAAAERVRELINEYRTLCGLPGLSRSLYLEQRAKDWSRWLVSRDLIVHSDAPSDGRAWGENIFKASGDPGFVIVTPIIIPVPATISTEELARQAVEGWKRSPGHNENMLHPSWRYVGVGVTCEYPPILRLGFRCVVVAQFSDRP